MTKSEFFSIIKKIDGVPQECKDYCEKQIEQIENEKARRAEKPSKASIETEKLKPVVLAYLETISDYQSADVIATGANIIDNDGKIRSAKVSNICKALVEEGKVELEKIKSTCKSGGKVNGYRIKR